LNLSFTHIAVVLIVALIVLGPDKLPDAARSIARVIRELRKMSTGLQAEVRDTFGDFAEPFSDLVNAVSGGVAEAISSPAPPVPGVPAAPGAGPPAEPLESLPLLGPTTGAFSPGPPAPTRAPTEAAAVTAAPGTFTPGPAEANGSPAEGSVVVPPLRPAN
jgi:Tat protein translocase TatB subunit